MALTVGSITQPAPNSANSAAAAKFEIAQAHLEPTREWAQTHAANQRLDLISGGLVGSLLGWTQVEDVPGLSTALEQG